MFVPYLRSVLEECNNQLDSGKVVGEVQHAGGVEINQAKQKTATRKYHKHNQLGNDVESLVTVFVEETLDTGERGQYECMNRERNIVRIHRNLGGILMALSVGFSEGRHVIHANIVNTVAQVA